MSDSLETEELIEVSSDSLREQGIPSEIIAWHERGRLTKAGQIPILEHYLNCLDANNGDERMAVQLCAYAIGESRMGVGITDNVFIQDQNRHGRSILDRHKGDARAVERLRKALARNGYNLKSDDHYIPTVARFFGDPQAIVNHTTGLGTLRQHLEGQGRTVEGEIELKARENGLPFAVKHKLNPKIVERIRRNMIKENPDLARKDQRELREAIVDKHGQKKVK